MHPIIWPNCPFKQWGIDCVGKIQPAVDGSCYINAIDFMSKYVVNGLLHDKLKLSIAQYMYVYDKMFCICGPPEIFTTDQGSEFNNDLEDGIVYLADLDHHCSQGNHPQAKSLCKKMNGTTKNKSRNRLERTKKAWVTAHPAVVWLIINSTREASTKLSPCEIIFGFKPSD